MVQMGDPVAAERVIRNLNRATIFDKELQIKYVWLPIICLIWRKTLYGIYCDFLVYVALNVNVLKK